MMLFPGRRRIEKEGINLGRCRLRVGTLGEGEQQEHLAMENLSRFVPRHLVRTDMPLLLYASGMPTRRRLGLPPVVLAHLHI